VCLCQRRAPTFCKACLKKSTSRVLLARSRLSLRICLPKISSRNRAGGQLVSSDRSRQLYIALRLTPSSRASPTTLPHMFIRSTACCLNSLLYRTPFSRSTLQLLSYKVCTIKLSHSRGSLHEGENGIRSSSEVGKCHRINVALHVGA
jgi:hypothetical protein